MTDTLSQQSWSKVSCEEVVVGFLKAEKFKLGNFPSILLYSPNYNSEEENNVRWAALWSIRGPLLNRIPSNTVWYKVNYLTNNHIDELLVIGRCGWDDRSDNNELRNVAIRRGQHLLKIPEQWETIILWGHDRRGPFTIIEGNNRLTAHASTLNPPEFRVTVYIGLSDNSCFWHLPDPI